MKLGSVTKLDKRNRSMSKKFADDVTSANCDVKQSGSPDSRRMVYKPFILQKLNTGLKNP